MKKRIFSFVLAVLMIASLLPATALAANIVDSGTCGANGSNLTWTLDSKGARTRCLLARAGFCRYLLCLPRRQCLEHASAGGTHRPQLHRGRR